MSVILKNNIGSAISYNDIIFGNLPAMRALMTKLIHNQADAVVERLIDCQDDLETELTRTVIQDHLVSVKESARDMLEDVLSDLRRVLHQALDDAEIKLDVQSMSFEGDEVSDVAASLYVTFKV